MQEELKEFNATAKEEVLKALKSFDTLKPGSEEQEKCARAIKALTDGLLNGIELENKILESELSYEIECDKMKNEKKRLEIDDKAQVKQFDSQLMSDVLTISFGMVQLIGGMLFYNALYNKGLKFEESGTIASSPVKQLTQKFTDFIKIKK